MRTHANMTTDGHIVGSVVAETPLPALTKMIANAGAWGKTRELALCGALGLKMQCFPMALNPKVYTLPKLSPKGVPSGPCGTSMEYRIEPRLGALVYDRSVCQ